MTVNFEEGGNRTANHLLSILVRLLGEEKRRQGTGVRCRM